MTQEEVRLKCVELSIKHYSEPGISTEARLAHAKKIEEYVSEPTNRRMLEMFESSRDLDWSAGERLLEGQQKAKKKKGLTFLPNADLLFDPVREFLSRKKQD
jgi:hypothetical protein